MSMTDDTPSTAPEWVARMNAGPLSPELRAGLDAWLAKDPRNQADFTLARLTWTVAQKLNTSEVAHNELRALNAAPAVHGWDWRRLIAATFGASPRRWAPAFAAVLLIVAGAVWLANPPRSPDGMALLDNGRSASTVVGEISNYVLPDGSKVTINAQSGVRVAFTRAQRKIILESGEAFFEVQHDDTPFVVVAGLRSVVVTGTKFDVKLDSYRSGLQVAVVEGHVNVGDHETDAKDAAKLQANDVFRFLDNAPPERLAVAANLVSAWQTRRLYFEGTTVGDVLFSVNRFARKPLRLGDPQLAELPLSGSFSAGDTDAVLFSLHSLYRIEAKDSGDALILDTAK